jgi:hypothetical protein
MSDTRVPISFIVDDPPINSSYWLRRQPEEMGFPVQPRGAFGTWVHRWRDQEPSKIIPNHFWKRFAAWAKAAGVKGKFTFLPCPAGLGCIDDKVEGYTDGELSELLALVREELAPSFSITPEIFTHSMAWDVQERKLLPITEYDWMGQQTEDVLADYMAEALRILVKVGINPSGITQPCNFRGDEGLYARAVLRAMKAACGVTRTFYFLNCEAEAKAVNSPVKIADAARGEYVVSVVSAIRADEPFWESLYGGGDVEKMAEYFISADGKSGRFIDLLSTGSPIIFHSHGQTLFSNGAEKGFQSLQLVVRRVEKHLAGRVRWVKMMDFAEERIEEAIRLA